MIETRDLREYADAMDRDRGFETGPTYVMRDAADEIDRLRQTVRAIADNATSWHAGEDGKAAALNVIAVWASEALAGRLHPSVEALMVASREASHR